MLAAHDAGFLLVITFQNLNIQSFSTPVQSLENLIGIVIVCKWYPAHTSIIPIYLAIQSAYDEDINFDVRMFYEMCI